jgi:hypothetical protein
MKKFIAKLSCLEFIQCVSECHNVAALDLTTNGNYYSYQTRTYCPVGKLVPGVQAHVTDAETTLLSRTPLAAQARG